MARHDRGHWDEEDQERNDRRRRWRAAFFHFAHKEAHGHFHHHHHDPLRRYHRYFRYGRPAVVIFNLALFYLLFSWAGFQGIGLFFALLIGVKEIIQFVFLLNLEKKILKPMEKLRQGVEEIARGRYGVRVECDTPHDLGRLITSFNEMAAKLEEGERIKAEYEENRKTLLANISHDLKTPITAIQGYIEAVLDGSARSEATREQYLQTIYRNTVYVNKLVDDLFLFSRLDLQKLEFHMETVSIRSFMADLMEEYRFDLSDRGIEFQYIDHLAADVCARLDPKRIHQALGNLIANAVKHGPEQGLALTVTMARQGSRIRIDVADNGPGIPADKLPHIFDRFYRIDPERTKDITSTGLGLAITQELIHAHDGEIAAASEEGQGACFTILLPVADGGADEVKT